MGRPHRRAGTPRATIERAVRIAVDPPAGPVLIGIPFECMMEQVSDVDHGKATKSVRAERVDDAAIQRALSLIAAAKNPIALTDMSAATGARWSARRNSASCSAFR